MDPKAQDKENFARLKQLYDKMNEAKQVHEDQVQRYKKNLGSVGWFDSSPCFPSCPSWCCSPNCCPS